RSSPGFFRFAPQDWRDGREVAYLKPDMRTSAKIPTNDEAARAQRISRPRNLKNPQRRRPASDWETPYSWLPSVRIWSPAVAPPLLGLILVFIASLPARPSPRAGSSTIATLPILFLLYFLCGVVYGLCLYFAPSLNSWAKILLG